MENDNNYNEVYDNDDNKDGCDGSITIIANSDTELINNDNGNDPGEDTEIYNNEWHR